MGVLLSLLSPLMTSAEFFSTKDQGTRGPTILTMEAGARALGMSGAYVAVSDDAGALQWNPAGLQQLSRSEIQVMQATHYGEQSQQFAGVAHPVWRAGDRETWGLSANFLSMDSFEVLEEGESQGEAHPQEGVVGLSYSRSLWRMSWGLTGKYIYAKTFDQSGRAYGMDVGLRSEGIGPWAWGATLSNFGTSLKLGQEEIGLPTVIRVGVARTWRVFQESRILTTVQWDAPADDKSEGSAGVEYAVPFAGNWRGAIRAGARTNGGDPMSVGGGITRQSLEVNYAYVPHSELGDAHRFDLTWRFGKELAPEVRRRALFEEASALVKDGRILEARPVLEELESLSPRQRDVQKLLQESQRQFAESLDPETLFLLARNAYDEGELSNAADLFRKILLVDPNHASAQVGLKKTERKIEQERAARLKAEVDRTRQQEVTKRSRLAQKYEDSGAWDAALVQWQKVLVLEGKSSGVQGRVTNCRNKLCNQAERVWADGDAEKALALYKAAETGEAFPRAAQGADRVRWEKAKRDAALQQKESRVAAESAQAIYKRGMAAYVAGELRKAKALFLEAQALNPRDKNIRQALDHVEAELKIHPEQGTP